MRWLVAFIILLMVLGPFRRTVLRSWRFSVPALLAGFGSWMALSTVMTPDEPWMAYAVPPLVALGAGAAVKEWLDGIFGKEK